MNRILALFVVTLLTSCGGGSGGNSSIPNTPSELTASVYSASQINLLWSNVSGATFYEIYRNTSDNSSDRNRIAQPLISAGTSYQSTGLSADTLYYYWLKACNSSGCSEYSNASTARSYIHSGRDSSKDFDTLINAGNTNPTGIWSDGTTMWAVDGDGNKIYAYNLSTKARDSSKDFDTLGIAGNTDPTGIWSDGTTMWAVDTGNDKIYAYNLSTKDRDSSKDFDTLISAGNDSPRGIWSDGTTMWVADVGNDKIYAYNLSTKARDSSKDFDTLDSASNNAPYGIWSDGTTMWVADWLNDKIYAYNFSTKDRDSSKDFDTLDSAGNTNPAGIWSNGTTMWVTDIVDDKIYAYHITTSGNSGEISKYKDVFGNACVSLEPIPGCTFFVSDGERIMVDEDPYYNRNGNGSDDIFYVIFNSAGTQADVYEDGTGTPSYQKNIDDFSGYISGSQIGVGTTDLYWNDVSGKTYWWGKNGVLYDANSGSSIYSKAIN